MKNKIIDYFFTISTAILFLGITITSILIIKDVKTYQDINNGNELITESIYRLRVLDLLPFIIMVIISFGFATTYAYLKNNYFKLVKMHIKPIYIHCHYYSLSILLLTYIFGSLMITFLPLMKPKDINSFYLYLLIAITGLLNLLSIGLESYSRIMIKIQLAIRRTEGVKEKKENINNLISDDLNDKKETSVEK